MRVLASCLISIVAACGGGSSRTREFTDASIDGVEEVPIDFGPCPTPPSLPMCSATCGNEQLDTCYTRNNQHGLCDDVVRTEACDGDNTPTCAELGYFGDMKPCTTCILVEVVCEACGPIGPNNLACAKMVTSFRSPAVAASGPLVGMVEIDNQVGPTSKLWVLDHLTQVAQGPSSSLRARGIVGVPTGWLVASSASALHTLDAAGNLGTSRPIDTNEPAMAYGPGQRVIVAWTEAVQTVWSGYFELVDGTGQVVLPKSLLFTGSSATRPGVAANDTSFFVGARGSLAKIASDGTRTITTGFPAGLNAHVTWHGTTGWYVAQDELAPGSIARRFDADGTPLAGVIAFGVVEDVLADGNDLLVLRYVGKRVRLDRIDSTGASVAWTEVGAGIGVGAPRIVRAEGSLYVVWTWQKLRIAQVSI